jgi:hypothetical protein
MLIAITASVYKISGNNHLWCNGITQNSIFLAMLLQKLEHRVMLLHNDVPTFKEQTIGLPSTIEVIDLKEVFNHSFDIIITLGHTMPEENYRRYRKEHPYCKFVLYVCGNTFISTNESIVFKYTENHSRGLQKYDYDQIWIVPQNEETDIHYMRFYYNTPNVTVVPFIWNPILGQEFMKRTNSKEYEPGKPIQSIGVLEPNLSIVKTFLMPLIIAEEYLRQNEEFKYLFIMCAEKYKTNKNLIDNLRGTELLKRDKVSVEARYPTINVLNRWADLVLSFQWKNPLNYLYLDVAWWGWPIVHNAELCQDIGYYYQGFDAQDGVTALRYAMKNHAKDDTYKLRMRQLIKRYTDENPNLLADYDRLLTNVVTDKFQKYTYNWRLNSIS